MVQEENAWFEPEVDNFANVITIENEAKVDLKITRFTWKLKDLKTSKWMVRWPNYKSCTRIIKRKYKDTDGLQDPVLRRFATVDGKFVQVLHVNINH